MKTYRVWYLEDSKWVEQEEQKAKNRSSVSDKIRESGYLPGTYKVRLKND